MDPVISLDEILRARRPLPRSDLWIAPDVAYGVHVGSCEKQFIEVAQTFLNKHHGAS
jgi:hypothetical protein